MLHHSDDIDCGTRHDRQKPENDIHHKRNRKIIEVVLFVFCSLPFHALPFMPDRFTDGIIAKVKIDRQCVEALSNRLLNFPTTGITSDQGFDHPRRTSIPPRTTDATAVPLSNGTYPNPNHSKRTEDASWLKLV